MATPPHAHRVTKVTIMGSFGGGAEQWTTGFYLGQQDADAALPTQAVADAIVPLWKTFFTQASSQISYNWSTDNIKLSSVGTDGKSNPADTIYSVVSGCAGGQANVYPPQIALVATLFSSKPRGGASKGRMYLPGVVRAIDNTGHIDGTTVAGMLGNLKTFLQAVNNIANTPDRIILASHGSINKDGTPKVGGLSSPENRFVQGVKLGNVYDTQRRRRGALKESYQTATI